MYRPCVPGLLLLLVIATAQQRGAEGPSSRSPKRQIYHGDGTTQRPPGMRHFERESPMTEAERSRLYDVEKRLRLEEADQHEMPRDHGRDHTSRRVNPNPSDYSEIKSDGYNLTQACTENRPEYLTDSSGTFTSPNWPSSYPPNLYCEWRIMTQDNLQKGVAITFDQLYLDYFDCISIYAFTPPNVESGSHAHLPIEPSPMDWSACGSYYNYLYNYTIYLSFTNVSVYFHSECYNHGYSGFRISYRVVNESMEVRLAGSGLPYEGRLEVNFNGVWGTVCDDYFNDVAASVACRCLGFDGGYYVFYRYGPGTGPTLLRYLNCAGTEQCLDECQYEALGSGDQGCSHWEDVSVFCYSAANETATGAPPTAACSADRPEVMTNYTGSVTSPNFPDTYPSNSLCEWRILSQQGIYLSFSHVYLNYGDCVTIEPTNYTSSSIGNFTDTTTYSYGYGSTFCGQWSTPYSLTMPHTDVKVTFSGSNSYSGFRMLYTADTACFNGGRDLGVSASGIFTSPFFPETYMQYTSCQWYIYSFEQMTVTFEYFDIPASPDGYCDNYYGSGYLEVYNSNEGYSTRYCNSYRPYTLYLSGYVQFYFVAGYMFQPRVGAGFKAVYNVQSHGTGQTPAILTTARQSQYPTTATHAVENQTATTTTTTTAPSTTPSSSSDIQPEPYIKITFNGTFFATYVIDSSCSGEFSSEFRSSYKSVVSRANSAINNGQLCANTGVLQAVAGSIQFVTLGNEGRVTFNVVVGVNPTDAMTIRSEEICAWDVGRFVQNFNNWRQLIISNIYGCPSVTFNPASFTQQNIAWSCL